jgi:hypothetical protein
MLIVYESAEEVKSPVELKLSVVAIKSHRVAVDLECIIPRVKKVVKLLDTGILLGDLPESILTCALVEMKSC